MDLRVPAASAAKTSSKLAKGPRASASDLRVIATTAADPRVAVARRCHFARHFAMVRVNRDFRADVRFWLHHLHQWNGSERWRSARSAPFVFASDASLQGFGFYLESAHPCATPATWPAHLHPGSGFSGSYSPEDARYHSESGYMTWCELFAVFAVLHTYRHVLRDSSALFVLDISPDVYALSRHHRLQHRHLRQAPPRRRECVGRLPLPPVAPWRPRHRLRLATRSP